MKTLWLRMNSSDPSLADCSGRDGSVKTIRYYLIQIPPDLFLKESDVLEKKQKKQEETNKTAKINGALKDRNKTSETLSG